MKRDRHQQVSRQGVTHTYNDLSDIWNVVWCIAVAVAVTVVASAPAVIIRAWKGLL